MMRSASKIYWTARTLAARPSTRTSNPRMSCSRAVLIGCARNLLWQSTRCRRPTLASCRKRCSGYRRPPGYSGFARGRGGERHRAPDHRGQSRPGGTPAAAAAHRLDRNPATSWQEAESLFQQLVGNQRTERALAEGDQARSRYARRCLSRGSGMGPLQCCRDRRFAERKRDLRLKPKRGSTGPVSLLAGLLSLPAHQQKAMRDGRLPGRKIGCPLPEESPSGAQPGRFQPRVHVRDGRLSANSRPASLTAKPCAISPTG